MKENLLISLLCMTALVLLCCMPIADSRAESVATTDIQTLHLNDGAPIPYFDGYQSELVKDVDALRGVTGAVDISWLNTGWSEEACTFHIHNIAVTDDVVAFFYTQHSDTPIALANDDQSGYDWAMRTFFFYVDGKGIDTVSDFREAHPVDANTLYCLSVWSLKEPLADGQALSVGYWDEKAGGMTKRYDIAIDRSQANDPTVAYAPMTTYQKKRKPAKDERAVAFEFVVERVAFTPFGNRCLINYRATSEASSFMDYRLTDEQGTVLMQTYASTTSYGSASKEHPTQVYNESWFLGGEGSNTLTLVPTGSDWLNLNEIGRTVSAPLDALPAEFTLEDGSTLRIESVERSTGGFTVWYTLDGYTSYLWVTPADENGNALDFSAENISLFSNTRGMLGQNVHWSDSYKGEIVSKASEEELAQFKTVIVEYTASDDHWLVPEDGVEILLQ